ncbi:MAG: DUF4194 domain-containing protein [Marinobacter sp.]
MAGIFDRITGENGNNERSNNESSERDEGNTEKPLASPAAADGSQLEVESSRTDKALREVMQELLRVGLLEASHRPNLYRTALVALDSLNAILEPLDLVARIDDIRGLVFLAVRHDGISQEPDDWSHPLIRKQRLNLEQTLFVAILRQHFVASEQEAGTGSEQAMVAVDELIPHVQVFLGDSGSEARDRTRVLQLLDQLKGHGLVSAPDSHERVVIRPMIAHLANPENLTALLRTLKQQLAGEQDDSAEDGPAGEGSHD